LTFPVERNAGQMEKAVAKKSLIRYLCRAVNQRRHVPANGFFNPFPPKFLVGIRQPTTAPDRTMVTLSVSV
jgi:hypothetical protein